MWFAQRGEDRKICELLRLGETADGTTGCYVDVGAWEPTRDSVTKHFYDRGWHGINVEPVPYYHDMLEAERPRDVNLRCVASDKNGETEIVWYEGTGLSTMHPRYGDPAQMNWAYHKQIIVVQARTLADILETHALPQIDFLKIDVEGWEREVLLGNDWKRFRPRLLVIEATVPDTDIPAWDTWDSYVGEQDYSFMHYDGLNRYYLDARQ